MNHLGRTASNRKANKATWNADWDAMRKAAQENAARQEADRLREQDAIQQFQGVLRNPRQVAISDLESQYPGAFQTSITNADIERNQERFTAEYNAAQSADEARRLDRLAKAESKRAAENAAARNKASKEAAKAQQNAEAARDKADKARKDAQRATGTTLSNALRERRKANVAEKEAIARVLKQKELNAGRKAEVLKIGSFYGSPEEILALLPEATESAMNRFQADINSMSRGERPQDTPEGTEFAIRAWIKRNIMDKLINLREQREKEARAKEEAEQRRFNEAKPEPRSYSEGDYIKSPAELARNAQRIHEGTLFGKLGFKGPQSEYNSQIQEFGSPDSHQSFSEIIGDLGDMTRKNANEKLKRIQAVPWISKDIKLAARDELERVAARDQKRGPLRETTGHLFAEDVSTVGISATEAGQAAVATADAVERGDKSGARRAAEIAQAAATTAARAASFIATATDESTKAIRSGALAAADAARGAAEAARGAAEAARGAAEAARPSLGMATETAIGAARTAASSASATGQAILSGLGTIRNGVRGLFAGRENRPVPSQVLPLSALPVPVAAAALPVPMRARQRTSANLEIARQSETNRRLASEGFGRQQGQVPYYENLARAGPFTPASRPGGNTASINAPYLRKRSATPKYRGGKSTRKLKNIRHKSRKNR